MRRWIRRTGMAVAMSWGVSAFGQSDISTQPPAAPPPPATAAQTQPRPDAEKGTVLRPARSSDGLTFHPADEVILREARSPSLMVAEDGGLILVFDFVPDGARSDATVMALSRSADGGRTWSRPQPVRIEDAGGRPVRGRGGVLVRLSPRYYRLYFVEGGELDSTAERGDPRPDGSGSDRPPAPVNDNTMSPAAPMPAPVTAARVRSAVSSDGERFKLDEAVALTLPQAAGAAEVGSIRLAAAAFQKRVHLYVSLSPPSPDERAEATGRHAAPGFSPRSGEPPMVRHYVSNNGRDFDAADRTIRTLPGVLTGLLTAGDRLRAFGAGEGGIWSANSENGSDWTPEPGVRLADARDAAIAKLDERSTVMVYTTALDDAARKAPELAMQGVRDGTDALADAARGGDQRPSAEAAAIEAAETTGAAGAGASGVSGADADAASAASEPPLAVVAAQPAGEAAVGLDSTGGSPRRRSSGSAAPGPAGSSPDAHTQSLIDVWGAMPDGRPAYDDVLGIPLPSFKRPVDYVEWYRGFLGRPPDNAQPHYAAMFPDALHPETSPPEWPAPSDMFNDAGQPQPPAPWDPADYPAWEASRLEYANLREQYRRATEHTGYAMDVMFNAEAAESADDGRPLLLDLILPALRYHRTMAKVNLGQSWRVDEEGRVPPEKMLDAWRTTLRSAGHLHQGATLIEHLVGVAEQALVEMNARQALAQGVFDTEEDMERALATLQAFDVGVEDPTRWIQGEYAMAMDVVQYVFSPADADGTPQLNRERAEIVASFTGDEDEHANEAVLNMGPDDAHESIRAFTEHYHELAEKMRTGYPEVRAGDLDDIETKNAGRTPLTRILTPSLSRVHTLRTRNEASRRATQLSYAVHLFKSRNGRWPESLDELPSEFSDRMRTDPFTGAHFGYRLGPDGPTIYSMSENGFDDGGVHSPSWVDSAAEVGSDDHVFWPPQP